MLKDMKSYAHEIGERFGVKESAVSQFEVVQGKNKKLQNIVTELVKRLNL